MNRLKLLVYILPRGKGSELAELCERKRIAFQFVVHGRGTANSDILSLLGIGETEKDVVFLTVDESRSDEVFKSLGEQMELNRIGGGIALSIPISAITQQSVSYDLLAGSLPEDSAKENRKHPLWRKK